MKKHGQSRKEQVKGKPIWSYSELLFARPSFLEGVARLFDFGGTLDTYNDEGLTADEANASALASDWRAIGQDMCLAMREWSPLA
ncbi:MAG TPA: hypothetical protein VMV29_17350 [Ktedonobacterales bacterium]|nr:hypothetical protein [Ktedonobacterales bacterium]